MVNTQNQSPIVVGLVASLIVVLALAAGWPVLHGDGSLLVDVSVEAEEISPNADGVADVTHINYELSRNGHVSIYFENEDGERFYFRNDETRGAGPYRAPFSGIVDGYRLPEDRVEGEILARLLQDGLYTWTVQATDTQGVTENRQGQIRIVNADSELPEIQGFSLQPMRFSPNQDGVRDVVTLSFDITKDVTLRVFLLSPNGEEVTIVEDEYNGTVGVSGPYTVAYDGGLKDGFAPPPDGTYSVVAIAEDREGQKVEVRLKNEFVVHYGGVPFAKIDLSPVGEAVRWDATAVTVCDTLYFNLTVENYGTTPIRTSGPPPGTVYDSDWDYKSLGWEVEPGAFRVGIGFENERISYPYRWAVGSTEDLEQIDSHYYLMPGERAVVSGGIRVTDVFGTRNPQPVWAGLIHEGVGIAQSNAHVDPAAILVDVPDEEHMPQCDLREAPWLLQPAKNIVDKDEAVITTVESLNEKWMTNVLGNGGGWLLLRAERYAPGGSNAPLPNGTDLPQRQISEQWLNVQQNGQYAEMFSRMLTKSGELVQVFHK